MKDQATADEDTSLKDRGLLAISEFNEYDHRLIFDMNSSSNCYSLHTIHDCLKLNCVKLINVM